MTLEELYQGINKVKQIDNASFRRLIRKMGLVKNHRGYYGYADAVVIIGWFRRGDRFHSVSEYMESSGKALYQSALGVDFSKFVDYEGVGT